MLLFIHILTSIQTYDDKNRAFSLKVFSFIKSYVSEISDFHVPKF